jgi:hypothetical protein
LEEAMSNERLDQVLRTVDPAKRASLKKLVLGTAFAIPMIASYSVKDLAYGQLGTCPITSTLTVTGVVTTTTTVIVTPVTTVSET